MEPLNSSKTRNVLVCPKCKKGNLRERIPRSQFVKTFLFFLPLKRYMCYSCHKKPYILKRD